MIKSPRKYGTMLGWNVLPLDLQSATYLQYDTLPEVILVSGLVLSIPLNILGKVTVRHSYCTGEHISFRNFCLCICCRFYRWLINYWYFYSFSLSQWGIRQAPSFYAGSSLTKCKDWYFSARWISESKGSLIGLDKQKFSALNCKYFLPISFIICVLGAYKNGLNETVLLSTHNICFGWEIRKYFLYKLLT